jgi:hypothetical protein
MPASLLIETRPEYGGTTLCRQLEDQHAASGHRVLYRDAREMPNYRAKLEQEFPSDVKTTNGESVLILDHFDPERDERMVRELEKLGWFKKVIIVTVNRSPMVSRPLVLDAFPFTPTLLYLWPLSREHIRQAAGTIFSSLDQVFLEKVVDKIYTDLLGLCIPLTPANVIMYAKILLNQGDFQPLNRVEIVDRYISETLRRPSDVYAETFSAKSKTDLLASLLFKMYKDGADRFDDRMWFDHCNEYQKTTLSDFDARALLHELIEGRILARFGSHIFPRYGFFYSYFLGRYLSSRRELLMRYLEEEEYLRLPEVIDVVTGLSSDNSAVVEHLTGVMLRYLNEFAERYVRGDFDPLLLARWPDDENEEETVWKPVQAAIAAGPAKPEEIDQLKTSFLAEARTADQQVRLDKFTELEHALFAVDLILGDALKNADDIGGPLKLAALDAVLRASLVAFQVGVMFAPELAKRNTFRWGGIQYRDFNKLAEDVNPGSPEAFAFVIDNLCYSIGIKEAEEIGTHKLAAVFRERAKAVGEIGFLDIILFRCILSAKGLGWTDSLKTLIEKAGRNSYYLCAMLDALMDDLSRELTRGKDRDSVKRLVATIQSKREYSKQAPGAKLISRMLEHLEKIDHFNRKPE